MAEDRSEVSAGDPGASAASGDNSAGDGKGLPTWVKVAGALTGVLGILATFVIGVAQIVAQQRDYTLKLAEATTQQAKAAAAQADAERKTAEANRDEVASKLRIAGIDLREHEDDLALQDAKLRLQTASAADQQLSTLISDVFTKEKGAEGDLAQLSYFISTNPKHRQSILDAIAARLEDPHSAGEVHIAFRLLDSLTSGPEQLDLLLRSNRIARQRLDQLLKALFWVEFSARLPKAEDTTKTIDAAVVPAINESARQVDLTSFVQKRYQQALYTGAFHLRLDPIIPNLNSTYDAATENRIIDQVKLISGKAEKANAAQMRAQAEVQAAIVTDSLASIQRWLMKDAETAVTLSNLDFSDCYLGDIQWPARKAGRQIKFDHAYVSGATIPVASLDAGSRDSLNRAIGVFSNNHFYAKSNVHVASDDNDADLSYTSDLRQDDSIGFGPQ
jgi:hypothetical protein